MTEKKLHMIQKNKRYGFRVAEVLCACSVLKHKKTGSGADSLPVFFLFCQTRAWLFRYS